MHRSVPSRHQFTQMERDSFFIFTKPVTIWTLMLVVVLEELKAFTFDNKGSISIEDFGGNIRDLVPQRED